MRLPLALLAFLLPLSAGAATYYIDPTCASPGDGTSMVCEGSTAPVATAKSLSASASDEWYWRAGIVDAYDEQITLQSSMTLGSYGSGAKPIIECDCAASDVTLYAFNKSGIVFRDIEVRRNATSDIRGVITLQGTGGGHTLDNVTLRGGYNNLRLLNDIPDVSIYDSEFHAAYDDNIFADVSSTFTLTGSTLDTPSIGTDTGDNIQFSGWDGVATIHDNDFAPAGDTKQGIIACNVGASTATLNATKNRIVGGRYGINTCAAGVITGNWLTGQVERGINFNPANAVQQQAVANVIAGSMTTAAIYVESSAGAAVDVDVHNNTLDGGFARGIGLQSTVASGSVAALNNIIAGDGSAGQIGTACGAVCAQFAEDYTVFWGLATKSSEKLGTHSIEADPQFVGGTAPNTAEGFRLKATSPGIRAGVYVGRLLDAEGEAFEAAPTIGALRGPSTRAEMTDANRATMTETNRATGNAATGNLTRLQ